MCYFYQVSLSQGYVTPPNDHEKFDEEIDLLIVCTGTAGLVAAIRAHHHGPKPLIVEKSTKIGSTSAYFGGGLWIPNNHVSRAAGIPDSQYLIYCFVVDDIDVSSRAKAI